MHGAFAALAVAVTFAMLGGSCGGKADSGDPTAACAGCAGGGAGGIGGGGSAGGALAAGMAGVSAAAGASSGAGGKGQAGHPAQGGTGGDWLHDPAAWTVIPYPEGLPWDNICPFFWADPSKIDAPGLSWSSCGDGCEVSPVGWLEQPYASVRMSTRVVEGLGVRTTIGMVSSDNKATGAQPSEIYLRWADGDTGEVVAAARRDDHTQVCGLNGIGREGVWAGAAGPGPMAAYFYFDRAHPEIPGRFSAPYPAELGQLPGDIWLWDSPPASLIHAGGPKLIRHVLDGKTIEFIDGGDGASKDGEAQGDLTVWTIPSQHRIAGWSPDGKGFRVFAEDIPFTIAKIALSDTHMTALLVDGYPASETHIWSSPRTTDPTAVQATTSPSLSPADWNVDHFETWDDWAAYTIWKDPTGNAQLYSLVLVQLSTWKAWQIPAAKGKQYPEITIGPTHVYVTESNFPIDDKATTRRLLRYELAKVPQIAQPL
jgi:hypothetical protein